jgi:Uma2 family endonuclease
LNPVIINRQATPPSQPDLTAPPVPADKAKPLPLQAGDHLTASEFLRRYEASEFDVRAELINGIVYLMCPVNFEWHGKPRSIISGWLGVYAAHTPSIDHANRTTVKLGRIDLPQPDSLLLVRPEAGGNCRITSDGYMVGAPEFVAEISASTASYDSREKLQSYLRAGVREYLIWRTYDAAVDWLVLQEDDYVRVQPDGEGIIRSPHFPGLWLNTKALLAFDRLAVLKTLEAGLNSR